VATTKCFILHLFLVSTTALARQGVDCANLQGVQEKLLRGFLMINFEPFVAESRCLHQNARYRR